MHHKLAVELMDAPKVEKVNVEYTGLLLILSKQGVVDKTGLWIKIGQQKEVVDVYTAQYYNWNKFVIKYTSYFLFLLILEEKP